MTIKLALLSLGLALTLESAAHQGLHQVGQADAPPTAGARVSMPAIAARYLIEERPARAKPQPRLAWYLYRGDHVVETANPAQGTAERWERDSGGRITHARYFHGDRRVVEAAFGELRTRNMVPDWRQLGAVFDPREVAGLRKVGATRHLGQAASIYRGRVGDESLEVTWLESAAIAARVVRASRRGTTSIVLAELRDERPESWPHVGAVDTATYQRIDLADLGDMESDPFVKRLLRAGGGHAGHAH